MAKEIERKYLINVEEWSWSCHIDPCGYNEIGIEQGYLFNVRGHVGRVRGTSDGKYVFTYKGPTKGITRTEIEHGVHPIIGSVLMFFCGKTIKKTRTFAGIPDSELVMEVDHFHNLNRDDFYIAEVELPSEDTEFTKPSWLGEEVSDNQFYYNSNLIKLVN